MVKTALLRIKQNENRNVTFFPPSFFSYSQSLDAGCKSVTTHGAGVDFALAVKKIQSKALFLPDGGFHN
jgi:hypothetical protein